MSNPTSTIDTFLCKGTDSGSSVSYSILLPIKEYPDLGGEPESIDVTTLSDHIRHSVPGIQDVDTLAFTCNYDKADMATVNALSGTDTKFAVVFGANSSGTPDGHDGIVTFTGDACAFVTGAGVNDAREMTVSIALSSEFEYPESITIA